MLSLQLEGPAAVMADGLYGPSAFMADSLYGPLKKNIRKRKGLPKFP